MKNCINKCLNASIETKQKIASNNQTVNLIEESVKLMLTSFRAGGAVYFAGNGGSAADAQHLSAELSGKFYIDREPLAAEALHCNSSFLTAVANDYSYDIVYARMLAALAQKGDVLVGLSTSGNSKNIVKAFEKAKELGIKTIALTGEKGGLLKNIADICICVPSDDTPRIQESHITIGHIICELVEANMFAQKDTRE